MSVPNMLSGVRSQGCFFAPVAAILLTASMAFYAPLPLMARTGARQVALTPYDRAQRQREALEGRPEEQRTRTEYTRVLNAYRAIYHNDPASSKADASIAAVAELLAEEGRIFEDEKALHDAIGQYEFLRKEYPYSRLRASALLTEGAIYYRDLGDRESAKTTFQQFLKSYPKNPLAEQARQSLKQIRREELAEKRKGRSANTTKEAKNTSPSSDRTPSAKTSAKAQSAPAVQPPPQEEPKPQPAPEKAETKTPAPQEPPAVQDTSLETPPPHHGQFPLVTGIRHWSTPVYTRVAIDLDAEVKYEAARVPNPDRIYFDLHGVKLAPELVGKAIMITDDGFLKRIRAAQFSNDITRVVLDVSNVSDYSAFLLPNPYRLIIDIHGSKPIAPEQQIAKETPAVPPPTQAPQTQSKPEEKPSSSKASKPATPQRSSNSESATATKTTPPSAPAAETAQSASSLKEVASLGNQPNRLKATKKPTSEPIAASVAGTTPASDDNASPTPAKPDSTTTDSSKSSSRKSRKKRGNNKTEEADAAAPAIHEAAPTADGERSLVRALGLKIGRIVVDAGHGGHDSGTLGPGGIEEKDIVLDVALRVGKLLTQQLGAEVIYTRDDDTFIPLETRTAIANKAQADLFLSIHANSSRDSSARGVETYYLNFTASPDALEVAARENAVSQQSVHQLSDLVKKIALKDKIEESREFAADVQEGLYDGLQKGNPGLKDRGVKKAPFVVLIGANMPSILAEISFLTNPDDARELRDPAYRQRIAESIYHGVAKYVSGLSGVKVAQMNSHTSN